MKKIIVSAALFTAALTSCTPAAMEGLGRGLASAANTSASEAVTFTCSGTSFGTITQVPASLTLTSYPDGTADGTFTSNGTLFQAGGKASIKGTGTSAVNLSLDNYVSGGGGVNANAYAPGKTLAAGANLSVYKGSKGFIGGTIDSHGNFAGTYRGVTGNYRLAMICRV